MSAGRLRTLMTRFGGPRVAAAGVVALVLILDQVTKSFVVATRRASAVNGSRAGGPVSVRLVRNNGASFGIGSGHPVIVTLVAVALAAVVLALLVLALRSRSATTPAALCLAAVLGGALGNLADRLFRSPGLGRGAVVDWIHVGGYPATFNLADVAIRLGAVGALAAVLGAGRLGKRRPLPCRD
jgi:signal peptidase II